MANSYFFRHKIKQELYAYLEIGDDYVDTFCIAFKLSEVDPVWIKYGVNEQDREFFEKLSKISQMNKKSVLQDSGLEWFVVQPDEQLISYANGFVESHIKKTKMVEIHKRRGDRVIDDGWLKFFYEEILLYCQNDETDFEGYNLNKNPFIKKLESELGFELIDKMDAVVTGKPFSFYYSSSEGKIKSLFYHLRNAFSHNRIFYLKNEEGYVLEDVSKGKLSMYVEINSLEKFRNIIINIKKNYKKYEAL